MLYLPALFQFYILCSSNMYLLAFFVFSLCTYLYCFVVILLFYVFLCFVVIVVLLFCVFLFLSVLV
jgi:hypothetical protein